MKKLTKVLAALLAIALLSGCSLISVNKDKIIVATVGEETITKEDLDSEVDKFFASYGMTRDSEEVKDSVHNYEVMMLESMVDNLIVDIKTKEMGLDVITDEDRQKTKEDIDKWVASQRELLLEEFKKDETITDPETKADETIADYFMNNFGVTQEEMVEQSLEALPNQKLFQEVVKDVKVTEEEAKSIFDQQVETDAATYAQDLPSFVSDYEGGMSIYNIPENVFYVKHILIALPDEQQTEISNLRNEGNDEEADKKREEYLKAVEPKAQEALSKVNAGEDFDALIETYGGDPGMTTESGKEKGYLTCAGNSISFVAEFADACDGLTADGMTTGLVASDFGYHIIRRTSTLPAGPVNFEDVKDQVIAKETSARQQAKFDDQMEIWRQELNPQIEKGYLPTPSPAPTAGE